jgi:hypothetical protein
VGVGAPAATARRYGCTDDSNPDPVCHDPVSSFCAPPEHSLGTEDSIAVQEVRKVFLGTSTQYFWHRKLSMTVAAHIMTEPVEVGYG